METVERVEAWTLKQVQVEEGSVTSGAALFTRR
jgi:hypothetical protein